MSRFWTSCCTLLQQPVPGHRESSSRSSTTPTDRHYQQRHLELADGVWKSARPPCLDLAYQPSKQISAAASSCDLRRFFVRFVVVYELLDLAPQVRSLVRESPSFNCVFMHFQSACGSSVLPASFVCWLTSLRSSRYRTTPFRRACRCPRVNHRLRTVSTTHQYQNTSSGTSARRCSGRVERACRPRPGRGRDHGAFAPGVSLSSCWGLVASHLMSGEVEFRRCSSCCVSRYAR